MVKRLIFILALLLLPVCAIAVELDADDDGKIDIGFLPTTDFSVETDPANATDGQMWFNNATNQIKVRNGDSVYYWNATGFVDFVEASPTEFFDAFLEDSLGQYANLNYTYDMVYDDANARVKGPALNQLTGMVYANAFSSPYYVQARFLVTSSESLNAGPAWNCNGDGTNGTGYYIVPGTSGISPYKWSGGLNNSNKAGITGVPYSGGKTLTADTSYTMRVEVDGSSAVFFIDFNDDGDFSDADEEVATITDESYVGGYVGFVVYGHNSWIDDFRAGGL